MQPLYSSSRAPRLVRRRRHSARRRAACLRPAGTPSTSPVAPRRSHHCRPPARGDHHAPGRRQERVGSRSFVVDRSTFYTAATPRRTYAARIGRLAAPPRQRNATWAGASLQLNAGLAVLVGNDATPAFALGSFSLGCACRREVIRSALKRSQLPHSSTRVDRPPPAARAESVHISGSNSVRRRCRLCSISKSSYRRDRPL